MARPRSYPPAVDEAIWAAMRAGRRTGEIVEMLANDQLGIGRSIPMPKRTVQEHASRLRKERGEPSIVVDSLEDCQAVATEIRLAFLVDLRATQRYITAKRKAEGRLNAGDLSVLTRCQQAITDIERAVNGDAPAKGRSRSKSATNPKSGTLSELARQRETRETKRQGDETQDQGSANPLPHVGTDIEDGSGEAEDEDLRQDDATRSAESARVASSARMPAAA